MTLMDRGISVGTPSAIGQSLEIRWSSLRNGDQNSPTQVVRCEFVLRLQVINREHAVVEAWVESPTDRRTILDRQPMRITLDDRDERWMHFDVIDEHQSPPMRVAALSLPRTVASNGSIGSSGSSLFAQTSLLCKAGFAAGTHDRPRVLQHAANAADAATA